MRNRRILFLVAIFIFLFPFFACAELKSFVIVSDTHVGAGNSIYPAFIRTVEDQKIHVIIHTGDAIHTPGRSSQWETFFEITGPDKTLHLAPGNHDIQDKESLATYLQFFSKLYYSFSDDDTLFVFLNTELPGETGMVTGVQFEWLEQELKRSFRYKFVFLHRPLFSIVPNHGLDRHKKARDRLHQLFEQQDVSLVVAGHDHFYSRGMVESITYVLAAGGGGVSRSPEETAFYFRYITATREKNGYSFIVRELEGRTTDEFVIVR